MVLTPQSQPLTAQRGNPNTNILIIIHQIQEFVKRYTIQDIRRKPLPCRVPVSLQHRPQNSYDAASAQGAPTKPRGPRQSSPQAFSGPPLSAVSRQTPLQDAVGLGEDVSLSPLPLGRVRALPHNEIRLLKQATVMCPHDDHFLLRASQHGSLLSRAADAYVNGSRWEYASPHPSLITLPAPVYNFFLGLSGWLSG